LGWWCIAAIPSVRRLRQEDLKIKAQTGLPSESCLKTHKNKTKQNKQAKIILMKQM
jgi:hypothetical protein